MILGDNVYHRFRIDNDNKVMAGYSGIVKVIESGINGRIGVEINGEIRFFSKIDLAIKNK